ncbi:hypothetical protein [Streptomyces sp. JJ38]|uniref:hypothetical protein n=1 Tax=Streptomyces sp. JJ38 TaxID=2738128 RepID=UPI001C58DF69|nr:hypothetical protein [Streptomyces sp. JJ38]MBW1595624.1 hypothetical protein [Streptomyces sp. JJ38]
MYEHDADLPQSTAAPHTRSRPLPPYRGILAVDAKDFTGRPAIEHEVISRLVPELLRTSLERAGLARVWADRVFPASTGDGYVLGFDPTLLPLVLHPWLLTLQETLTDFNIHSHGTVPIRLRVSLHVGPLPDTGDAFGGNGTVRNDTHRLLDSTPVKAVLASSSENITHVAAILSDRCYEDAVASGYTGRHPDHFIEVAATVEGKPFAQRAWIHVPAPSGPLRNTGVLGQGAHPGDGGQARPEGDDGLRPGERHHVTQHWTTNSAPSGNVNTGTVQGGQSVSNHHTVGDHVGGNKAGQVRGFQGDQVRGDKNQDRR